MDKETLVNKTRILCPNCEGIGYVPSMNAVFDPSKRKPVLTYNNCKRCDTTGMLDITTEKITTETPAKLGKPNE